MNEESFSVLVPYRATPEREPVVKWIAQRWNHIFPNVELIIDDQDPGGVFSRSRSINRCFQKATKDVVAIVDADIWPDPRGIKKAVKHAITTKGWSRPCMNLIRLNRPATERITQMPVDCKFPEITPDMVQSRAKTAGGVVVMTYDQFDKVKMDNRFVGWGGEDNRLFKMLNKVYGKPHRWNWAAIHFWHPVLLDGKGRKIWPGQKRRNNKLI